jgi:type III secretion system (T3SS) SseB-like protein
MANGADNALESVLIRALDDPDLRPEFYRQLLSSDLIAGGRVNRETKLGEAVRFEQGDTFHLAMVQREGRVLHPIFTSRARVDVFTPEGGQYFQIVGRELFASTLGANFVLNPGSDLSKELVPEEIRHWLAQLVGTQIKDQAKRTIGAPAEYPTNLVKAFGILFVNRQVETARLAEIRREGQNARLVLAVETESNWRKLSSEIAAAANAAMPGFALELVRINPADSRDAYAQQLLAIAPFYERKNPQQQKE